MDLHIKYLFTLKTEDAIKENLGKLPKTLGETYSKIYKEVLREETKDLAFAKKALMWVLCSRRPLSSQEWVNVTYWPERTDEVIGLNSLLELCHNLVVVDSQSQVVRFAHLSVQEYLETLEDFTTEIANEMAARFCFSVLLSDEASIPSILDKVSDYAVCFWMNHASKCTGSQDVLGLVRNFLGTATKPGRAYCNWFQIAMEGAERGTPHGRCSHHGCSNPVYLDVCLHYLVHLRSEPLNPVFAACCFHLGVGLEDFWEWGTFDINSRNSKGRTLLHVASLMGNERIVRSLLENGADVNTTSKEKACQHNIGTRNPLTAAISYRRARVAAMLLDYGAIIGCGEGQSCTNPFEFAANRGDKDVVEAIINRGGCSTKITEAVLMAAAGNRHHAGGILEMLLVMNPTIQITEAILSAAAENRNKKALKTLLATSPTTKITETIFSAAAKNGNREALRMILDRDPAFQITEAILSVVAKNDQKALTLAMLLARNSTIQVTEAILLMAAQNINEKALEMLLARDPTFQITGAVLSAAAGNCNEKALETLLLRAPNIEITEAVLAGAARNSNEGVLKILLDRGPTRQVKQVVLPVAALNWNKKVLEMLLASDPTLQITEAVLATAAWNRNELGRDPTIQITGTLLSATAINVDEKTLEKLLLRVPNIEITEAVLSAAARKVNGKTLEKLPLRVPNIEITEAVLAEAARNSNEGVLKILLDRDPTIQITEAILLAAVGNGSSDYKALELLLARDAEIKITEAIIRASKNVKVRRILARNAGNTNITVNSTAFKASAYFASSILFHELLGKYDTSSISSESYLQFVYAAVQGGDRSILRSLLELGGELLEADEHGWTLQMVGRQSGFVDGMLPSVTSNRIYYGSEASQKLEGGIERSSQNRMGKPTALENSRLPECIKLQSDGTYILHSGKCSIQFIPFLQY